jgi:glutathione S-transferase
MIKLYHAPRTRSTRVRWLLEELEIPYELETLAFPDGLKSPEYLTINPLGKVPAIRDDGLTMCESGAIVEYLVETHGKGRLAPAPGTPGRGPYLQWLHFSEATALPPLSDMAQHMLFRPENERIPAVVEDGRARALVVLGVIESALAGKQYVLGNEFSAADVMLGYALLLMKWFGLLTEQYPNAAAYMSRLEERPAFQKAQG